MKCPECGHELRGTVNFCSNCGAALKPSLGDTTRVILAVTEDTGALPVTEAELAALRDVPEGTGVLVVIRGPNQGTRYVLDNVTTTAGRHPQSDIFLDDVTVSRHHAKFSLSSGHVWLTDLNSLNGSYVNRDLIDGEVALRTGDEVQIGKFRLLFLVDGAG